MGLRTRIQWLIIFRAAFLLVMGGSALILRLFYQEPFASELVAPLIMGLAFTLISLSALGFLREEILPLHGIVQFAWDIGFTTYLVANTGGLQSAFILLYGLDILMGAAVFVSPGALFSALSSSLAFTICVIWVSGSLMNASAQFVSRLIASDSFLILFGASIAWLFRHRTELIRSLERTTADLNELSHLHSTIIDHISSGILYADKVGKVLFMNQAALKILGESWVGRNLQGSALECFLRPNGRFESQVQLPSGTRNVGHHIAEIPKKGSVVVFQDVTEIRELENRVQTKEKLAAVGQLAAGIAHEIRNPLASISGSIQLIQSELTLDPETSRLMRIVLRETDRLDHLAKNFLDYARPSQLLWENVSLSPIFAEFSDLIKNNPRFSEQKMIFRQKLSEDDLSCRCDSRQLKQILWNLLKNALDANSVGGQIELTATSFTREAQDFVRFSVADTGPGIPDDLKEKVFVPFFTTKTLGTGLGLSLVYEMVRAHGGNIGLETQLGRGTTFWFEFPKNGPAQETRKTSVAVPRAA